MKFLISLFGAALFAGSVYLLQWLYPQFDVLELREFGLYLAASFVGMTFGAFFFFLPFSFSSKPKATKALSPQPEPPSLEPILQESPASEPLNPIESNDTIHDEEPSSQESPVLEPLDKLEHNDAIEPHVHTSLTPTEDNPPEEDSLEPLKVDDNVKPVAVDLEVPRTEIPISFTGSLSTKNTQDHIFNPSNLMQDNENRISAKLSDIEPWSHQRRIKKLSDGSQLTLVQKQKAGLSLAIIQSQGKDIGYVSRLQFTKIQDKLNRLNRIELDEVIYEGSKVVYVGIRFILNPLHP